MIIDAIISFFFWLVETIVGLLPTISAPAWLDVSGPLGTIMGVGGAVGNWVPMPLVVTVLTAILAAYAVSFGIKLTRVIVSFFTGGGGSAA